jgi:rubrerythrin
MNAQTQENLRKAMEGEAFAYAKYMSFAEEARRNGHDAVADLFERIAKTGHLEHFGEMARLTQLVGADADNLNDAIQNETQESQTTYAQFAEEAVAAGDQAAAARFLEIAKDEARNRAMFQASLDSLDNKTSMKEHLSTQ